MKFRLFPVLALSLAAIIACGGSDKKEEVPPTPPAPPAEPARPPAPMAGSGDIGVTECDDYIKKMTECIGKMDPTVKATYESTFASTKDAWKQAAATPEGKAGLQAGCKAALDAMASMPCGAGTTGAAPVKTETKTTTTTTTTKEEVKKEEPVKEEPKPVAPPPPGQGKGRNR